MISPSVACASAACLRRMAVTSVSRSTLTRSRVAMARRYLRSGSDRAGRQSVSPRQLLGLAQTSYVLQHITASMCCVRLCALRASVAAFPLLSSKSGVELQHIIGAPTGRDCWAEWLICEAGRLRSSRRGDRMARSETPRITRSGSRRPRRMRGPAPVGPRQYLSRARLPAPRRGGRLCAAHRYAGQ